MPANKILKDFICSSAHIANAVKIPQYGILFHPAASIDNFNTNLQQSRPIVSSLFVLTVLLVGKCIHNKSPIEVCNSAILTYFHSYATRIFN